MRFHRDVCVNVLRRGIVGKVIVVEVIVVEVILVKVILVKIIGKQGSFWARKILGHFG